MHWKCNYVDSCVRNSPLFKIKIHLTVFITAYRSVWRPPHEFDFFQNSKIWTEIKSHNIWSVRIYYFGRFRVLRVSTFFSEFRWCLCTPFFSRRLYVRSTIICNGRHASSECRGVYICSIYTVQEYCMFHRNIKTRILLVMDNLMQSTVSKTSSLCKRLPVCMDFWLTGMQRDSAHGAHAYHNK